jgi:hypothetical protein
LPESCFSALIFPPVLITSRWQRASTRCRSAVFPGNFTSGTNQYNGSSQYNYAAKHNPQVFFSGTNGGNNNTTSNPQARNYAPLQQLSTDLANNTVA